MAALKKWLDFVLPEFIERDGWLKHFSIAVRHQSRAEFSIHHNIKQAFVTYKVGGLS
jgi:hypothetical protein